MNNNTAMFTVNAQHGLTSKSSKHQQSMHVWRGLGQGGARVLKRQSCLFKIHQWENRISEPRWLILAAIEVASLAAPKTTITVADFSGTKIKRRYNWSAVRRKSRKTSNPRACKWI
ncbi:hypothetical protein PV325_011362 [Microctonus aethiopoides]|nr:hypothetical protein PV325_011362 [Microctonus aethiopoides]